MRRITEFEGLRAILAWWVFWGILMWLTIKFFPDPSKLMMLIVLVVVGNLAVVASFASYRCIEKPLIKFEKQVSTRIAVVATN